MFVYCYPLEQISGDIFGLSHKPVFKEVFPDQPSPEFNGAITRIQDVTLSQRDVTVMTNVTY